MASFQDLYVGLEPYRNVNQPFCGILRKAAEFYDFFIQRYIQLILFLYPLRER
jgi:hypothetical protein